MSVLDPLPYPAMPENPQYVLSSTLMPTSPVTSELHVSLWRLVTYDDFKAHQQGIFYAHGELANAVESERVRIFGQKRVSDEDKQAQWNRYCYTLELVARLPEGCAPVRKGFPEITTD